MLATAIDKLAMEYPEDPSGLTAKGAHLLLRHAAI